MSTDITSVKSSSNKAPRRKTKVKKSGTPLSDLIIKIVSASKERTCVSLVALKKALAANGNDVARNNSRINLAVKRMVVTGKLTQTKGTGASGSFKIGMKTVTKRKKPKKATRKKAKKPAGAKKTPKKSRRMSLKSPGKADETAAEPAVKIKRSKRIKRRVSKTTKAKDAKK
ncbi:Histone H1.3 Histone H1c Histone H1s-2 [Triplophysa tibetana]|uniref:Histone H1.3 Histone H1c Histone H1s-2 n=1 Tax=Triplophysa tibetana TaxID=1572043 RepID=A0A5A9NZU8_9TELE|nr:Histone H1.3 Histone H1c Histone H1s-2 [Triplophysa tibetana]